MIESDKCKKLRCQLVEGLGCKGISDKNVLQAIKNVPRHLFMDESLVDFSYVDRAFAIGLGQTISQPYTVAVQSSLLGINKGDKVLEIGTGSGYQAAILSEMGADVYTVERIKELQERADELLKELGYEIHSFHEDGYLGLPDYAPFDKILITAATPSLPTDLLKQLKVGGKFVAPIGDAYVQTMTIIDKISEAEYKRSSHGQFVFVPLLQGKA